MALNQNAATYASDTVQVIVNGVPVTGYADGTFVKVARTKPGFTMVVGADGSQSRSRTADKSGTIEITLLQTSPSNDVLSAQAEADELLGIGQGTCLVKDGSGTTLCAAANSWVEKFPDIEFDKEIKERVWVIACGNLKIHVGSN
jgi:hypothetical protein